MEKCLWLGTILKEEDIKDANDYLNKLLEISSVNIYDRRMIEDLAIVYFTIDNSDVPKVAMTRFKVDDIKWESDYPEYSIL